MSEFLFTNFSRESRPLSDALNHRAIEYLGIHLAGYSKEERQTIPVEDLVAELVAKVSINPPQIGPGIEGVGRTGFSNRPTDQPGTTSHVDILAFAVETSGDIGWLRYWPDRPGVDTEPVDKDALGQDVFESVPYDRWDAALAMSRWEARQAMQRWKLELKDDSARLLVHVCASAEEIDRAADSGPVPSRVVPGWIDEVRPIVDAIADQIRRFNDHDLPTLYRERITNMRRAQRGLARTLKEIEIPFESLSQPDLSIEQTSDTDEPPAVSVGKAQPSVVTLGNYKLATASFEDVVRTIRVWANGAQRYPRAYSRFSEDELSDTLCVTLNAALPGSADREVYRHVGKTDITVRADAVDEGLGPEVVFVCESKIWDGQSSVAENFNQLCGYLGTREASAVLLYGVPNKHLKDVQAKAVAALQALDGYQSNGEPISQWPLLRFERDGQQIDLVVAFVHTYNPKATEQTQADPEPGV